MYLEIKSTETSKRKTMKDTIKHYKTLKNINGKLNKWHYIPSSQMEKFTLKRTFLPKLIHRINSVSIKIPASLFLCLFVSCFEEFDKFI